MIIFHSGGLSKNAAAPEGRFLIFGRFPLTPVKIFVDFFFFFKKINSWDEILQKKASKAYWKIARAKTYAIP